jgi:hypothetical protein
MLSLLTLKRFRRKHPTIAGFRKKLDKKSKLFYP